MTIFNRLQVRLLIALLVILMITLGIIVIFLLVFLRTRPVPIEGLLNDLAAVSLETDFRTLLEERRAAGEATLLNRQQQIELVSAFLDEIAQTTSYSLLLVDGNKHVLYDSTEALEQGTTITVQEQRPLVPAPPPAPERPPVFTSGIFTSPQGDEFVYVSRRLLPNPQSRLQLANVEYYVTAPRPQQTLRRVLDDFGENFFLPLCQAGLIGLVVAMGLSFWLARSVAKPLQAIAQSAGKVAHGDYDQRVPVTGPTEAQIVAEAFNYMTAQVQQSQQAQRDFLANVTHDLRTPLTSIQGFSQAIMDGVASQPEAAKHAAEIINQEAGRLTRLVNDLLDIAKIQAGRLQMLQHAVNLEHILKTTAESMSVKANQKNIRLHVHIAPLMRIAGDGDRLAQVFNNLVDNAIKHTDDGGQVWLTAEQAEVGVLVQVQDTGEGIPESDLPRIFERFYQVDKSRNRAAQHQGAGLGLAITAEIVRAHGGRIKVESQVGVGSRFSIWLPALGHDKSTIFTRRR